MSRKKVETPNEFAYLIDDLNIIKSLSWDETEDILLEVYSTGDSSSSVDLYEGNNSNKRQKTNSSTPNAYHDDYDDDTDDLDFQIDSNYFDTYKDEQQILLDLNYPNELLPPDISASSGATSAFVKLKDNLIFPKVINNEVTSFFRNGILSVPSSSPSVSPALTPVSVTQQSDIKTNNNGNGNMSSSQSHSKPLRSSSSNTTSQQKPLKNKIPSSHLKAISFPGELKMLFTIPQTFQRFVNQGDFVELKKLLLLHFDENCSFKNSAMKSEVYGHKAILDIYKSIVDVFPDFLLIVKKVKYSTIKKMITAEVISSGTKMSLTNGQQESNYNLVVSNPDNKIPSNVMKQANDIIKRGKRYKAISKSIWNFTLNEQLTKIVKFVTIQSIVSIKEADPITKD